MTTFPALIPSSRTFTPGEYPVTPFSGYSGVQGRVRHSDVFLSAQLRLSFLAISEAEMLSIWDHYTARRGGYEPFDLPDEITEGTSLADYVPSGYRWRYGDEGYVEDLPCGGHNVSLTLESVAAVAVAALGADLALALSLAAGEAFIVSEAPGADLTLSLSLAAGEATLEGVAVAGADLTLSLSLAAGAATAAASVDGADLSLAFSLTAGEASAGTESDPDFANVSLLLHMDGSNGSTTFTDSSLNALAVSPQGDAQISTAQSKYGGASGLFDGNVDRLHLPNGAAALSLDADFTVEVWVYPLSSADMMVLSGRTGNQQIFRLNYLGTGNIFCFVNGTTVVSTAAGIVANAWQHLALSRSGSSTRLFVDGQQQGSTNTSWTGTLSIERIAAFFFNGAIGSPPYYFNGYLDDLRITKGVARYAANFTPPTAPFPDA